MTTILSESIDVTLAAKKLVTAFSHNNTEAYFECFTDDATFILYNHPSILLSKSDYLSQWSIWQQEGLRIKSCCSSDAYIQRYGDIAIYHHHVETIILNTTEQQQLYERETIVFRLTPQGWLACHEHLSPYNN